MKKLSIMLLVVMVSLVSCAVIKEKEMGKKVSHKPLVENLFAREGLFDILVFPHISGFATVMGFLIFLVFDMSRIA